jgi:hypothetical protein
MYKRYNVVNEQDIRAALVKTQNTGDMRASLPQPSCRQMPASFR